MGNFFKFCGQLLNTELYNAEFVQVQDDSIILDWICHEIKVRSGCLKVENILVSVVLKCPTTVWCPKAKLFQEAMFFCHQFFYLIIEVQSGNEVLNRLVPYIWYMKLACWVLHGHFGSLLSP